MGAPLIADHISVDEYLSNPAYEHSEYVGGEIVELNLGSKKHGKIQKRIARRIDEYADAHAGVYVGTEVHCRLQIKGEAVYRLPDVAVLVEDKSPDSRFIEGAPDIAVEVRSPEDPIANLLRKFDDYFANGCKLGWLILPEEESVIILRPKQEAKTAISGESLDASDVLPGLSIAVNDLFV